MRSLFEMMFRGIGKPLTAVSFILDFLGSLAYSRQVGMEYTPTPARIDINDYLRYLNGQYGPSDENERRWFLESSLESLKGAIELVGAAIPDPIYTELLGVAQNMVISGLIDAPAYLRKCLYEVMIGCR
ncbi:hypothetical protein CPLU01_16053 [Colletotrichum plurivorum]|uniref:Uncharacterized protein n=1 Tax=Colletotrichum plurivorum TaxID=2175906 RepID=A0A8H6MPK1_9PEZI|nr:hypothetical protein CPLU01_16053 [Colletotrichum plurivorum]